MIQSESGESIVEGRPKSYLFECTIRPNEYKTGNAKPDEDTTVFETLGFTGAPAHGKTWELMRASESPGSLRYVWLVLTERGGMEAWGYGKRKGLGWDEGKLVLHLVSGGVEDWFTFSPGRVYQREGLDRHRTE